MCRSGWAPRSGRRGPPGRSCGLRGPQRRRLNRVPFAARVLELEHWSVYAVLHPLYAGAARILPPDALLFITEFHEALGIREEMLPVYLEEISSTLASHAYKQWLGQPTAQARSRGDRRRGRAADFQAIEHSMTEGHPCFVANNGRLGFGIGDYRAFAPETGAPVRLQWIAVHRSKAVFTASAGLDYRDHLEAELGAEALAVL